jgi:hypothetical protein
MAILLWAASRGRPTIVSDDGSLLFRHNIAFRWFSLFVALGIPLAITVLVFYKPPQNDDDLWAILGIYALSAVCGLPLWWESSRFALILTPLGMECLSPWRKRLFFAWDEIEELSFSSMNQWFIVRARYGRKFRVPILVSGLSDFLAQCEQHLVPDQLREAKVGYMQVGRCFPGT